MKNQILIGAIIIASAIIIGIYHYSSQQSYAGCVEACIGKRFSEVASCKEACR